MARQHEIDRKKQFLLKSLYGEPQFLSPIPEHPEVSSRSRSSSPRPATETERYSPLPDLIIEKVKQRRSSDESEEFYNKLEVKMKKLYRKLFYGEDSISNGEEFESDQNMEDTSLIIDGYDHSTANSRNSTDSDASTMQLTGENIGREEIAGVLKDIPTDEMEGMNSNSSEGSGKSEATPAESSSSNETSESTYDLKSLSRSEPVEPAGPERTTNNANSAESTSDKTDPNETRVIIGIENVMVHTQETEVNSEIELMRNQAPHIDYDSFGKRDESEIHCENLDFARDSIECANDCTINETAPMDLVSEDLSPILEVTGPVVNISPILPSHFTVSRKRPSENINPVAVEFVPSPKKKRVEVETQTTAIELKHAGSQTREINYREIAAQTDFKENEFEIEGVVKKDAASQTENKSTSDESTQTNERYDHFNILHINIQTRVIFFF